MGAALLIECRGSSKEDLEERIREVQDSLRRSSLSFGGRAAEPKPLEAYEFKHDPKDAKVYWDVRKGLIPIVGGAREAGTTMLLEDVACPVDRCALGRPAPWGAQLVVVVVAVVVVVVASELLSDGLPLGTEP